eukprot:g12263.t1
MAATAYGKLTAPPGEAPPAQRDVIDYLPAQAKLRNGKTAVLDHFSDRDFEVGWWLLDLQIARGVSWPFIHALGPEGFRDYFFSHGAFVVRAGGDWSQGENGIAPGDLLGMFYIKPNFPGRCRHICNGGFITIDKAQRLGVGQLMGRMYLRLAKDLGYQGSMFNLVFVPNVASIALWDKLGFTRSGRIPKVAYLKGYEQPQDAINFYYDLSTYDHTRFPVERDINSTSANKPCMQQSDVKRGVVSRPALTGFLIGLSVGAVVVTAWKRHYSA